MPKIIRETGIVILSKVSDTDLSDGIFPMPEDITTIGHEAFAELPLLIQVIALPDTLTLIDSMAFKNCVNLARITLPDSICSIGNGAFSGCSSLTTIILPDDLYTINQGAFAGCSSLANIILPNNLTSIDVSVFERCTSLTNISLPDTLTSINVAAFQGCTSLTSITLPDHLTSIGPHAFSNCTGLTSITLPDSLTSIGKGVFTGCTSLTSITISPKLSSLPDLIPTIQSCPNLTHLVIDTDDAQTLKDIGNLFPRISVISKSAYQIEQQFNQIRERGLDKFRKNCVSQWRKLFPGLSSEIIGHVASFIEPYSPDDIVSTTLYHDLSAKLDYIVHTNKLNLDKCIELVDKHVDRSIALYKLDVYLTYLKKSIPESFRNQEQKPEDENNKEIMRTYYVVIKLIHHFRNSAQTFSLEDMESIEKKPLLNAIVKQLPKIQVTETALPGKNKPLKEKLQTMPRDDKAEAKSGDQHRFMSLKSSLKKGIDKGLSKLPMNFPKK